MLWMSFLKKITEFSFIESLYILVFRASFILENVSWATGGNLMVIVDETRLVCYIHPDTFFYELWFHKMDYQRQAFL